MSRRLFGFFSLSVIAVAAVGLLMFTLLGTATGIAGNATASAFGARVSLDTPLTSLALVGPLPRVAADRLDVSQSASLARIGEIPAGGAIVQEIAALHVTSAVNLLAGTANATSTTAHVGLLKGAGALLGTGPLLPGPITLPILGTILGPGVGGTGNGIDLSVLKGVVSLDCNRLAALRGASERGLLEAITPGSHLLNLELLGRTLGSYDTLTDPLGSTADDHAAAFHLRVDLGLLGLPSLRIVEIWIYEVQGSNLRTPSLENATVGATVDMLHVKVLDKATGLLEADIKVGHAEATLSNCGQIVVPPPPPPQPPQPPVIVTDSFTRNVLVTKPVEAINGVVVASQEGLTARPGQEIEYSITVFNRSAGVGSCAVTSAVDQIPANMTLVSTAGELGGGRYDPISNTVIWDNLSIPRGEARRQGIVVRLSNTAPNGTYVNRVVADGSCGRFEGIAPGIIVRELGVLGVQLRRETPRTGVSDTGMMIAGGVMMLVAVGSTRFVLRRN